MNSPVAAAAQAAVPVLLLFLVPFGFFIPAGVLLSKSLGIGWPLMSFLYFVSDVILAFLFEPLLRLVALAGRRFPPLARATEAVRTAMARAAARYGSPTSGPIVLILIAFGIDPMTGRTAAAAAGHGFVAGWAIAITGDMLSFLVIAEATLKLNSMFGNSGWTIAFVLVAMLFAPLLFRRVKTAFLRKPAAP